MTDYPEHEKLKAIAAESQIIGEFLDTCGYVLAEWLPGRIEDRLVPVSKSIEQVLGDHFGIDLTVLEQEKLAMLDSFRGI